MILFYILLTSVDVFIKCTESSCFLAPTRELALLISSGALEMVFEITGIVRIFRNKDKE